MGKIVKYCSKCEEGFAEKFGFCPNCGENLRAFEMNPVENETAAAGALGAANVETVESFETVSKAEEATAAFSDNDILELDSADVPEEQETFIPASIPADANGNGNGNGYYQPAFAETETEEYSYEEKNTTAAQFDDAYSPTVIEAKDVQLRNSLLAGFGSLILAAVCIAWVWSLFVHSLPVFALEGDPSFAFVGPIEPELVETEKPPKQNDKEGGGGGGGGQENENEATRGKLPTQTNEPKNPLLMVTQMTNPTFVVKNETKGNIKRDPTNEQVGLTNGLTADNLSGGRGSGGGFGDGKGRGAGNGEGSGEGNGIGSGSGNGNGNGNGDGDGDGDKEPTIAKVVDKPAGVTVGIKILSKPQARYTDAGRQNNVQGTVTLKVTFTASGAIGSISAVSGLPYGLTEQAIAAARQIKFEPPKRNGVPYAITKTVSYSFTIY